MSLNLVNDLINNLKENDFVQNFLNELADTLGNTKNTLDITKNNEKGSSLKQEGCVYQVVDLTLHGAALLNTDNYMIAEETDIPKDVLDIIAEDSVLRYIDGKYVYDDELTR